MYEITLIDKIIDDLNKWVKENLPDSYSDFVAQNIKLGNVIRGASFNRILDYLWKNDSEKGEQISNLQAELGLHMHLIDLNYKNQNKLFELLGKGNFGLEGAFERINLQNEIDSLYSEIRVAKEYAMNMVNLLKSVSIDKDLESQEKDRQTQKEDGLTGEALALAMLVEHPDWPDKKIAEAVGVNRTTLYDWPNFKKAKEALKQGKKKFPRGSKNSETGDMEAWEAET